MPRSRSNEVHIVPLGGLGEVGMNCLAIEDGDGIMVVDCGVTFDDRDLGLDRVRPSFEWLLRRADRVVGLVLTHGHEDHIGAVPLLLAALPHLRTWGPAYALGLLSERIKDRDMRDRLHRLDRGEPLTLGPFRVESAGVTHSTPDCTSLRITTSQGHLVHTGDFKVDLQAPGKDRMEVARFEAWGDDGVELLMSDSTNAMVPGRAGSEGDVMACIRSLCDAPHRVAVAMFSSNLYRIQAAISAAQAADRRVCVVGRSLLKHIELGKELGYLDGAMDQLEVSPAEAMALPRDRVLALVAGTQGEPRGALTRLAHDDHRDFALEAGDRVLFSARIIPGHEVRVFEVHNALLRKGVEVMTRRDHPRLHVSGHGRQEDARHMMGWLRPRAFLPLHGTLMQLRAHETLAREEGIDETLVVEDGQVVALRDGTLRVADAFDATPTFLERDREVGEPVVRDRQGLARHGFVMATLSVDDDDLLADTPQIFTRGVLVEDEERALLDEAEDRLFDQLSGKARSEQHLIDDTKRTLRRFFRGRLGSYPMIYAMVVYPYDGKGQRVR